MPRQAGTHLGVRIYQARYGFAFLKVRAQHPHTRAKGFNRKPQRTPRMTDLQLDERILVEGIGMGWVAVKDGDRVHIEFPQHVGAEPITIPSDHVGTDLYEATGDVTTALEHMAPSDD